MFELVNKIGPCQLHNMHYFKVKFVLPKTVSQNNKRQTLNLEVVENAKIILKASSLIVQIIDPVHIFNNDGRPLKLSPPFY